MSNSEDTSHYQGALLEVIDSKLDAILEAHQALVDVPVRLNKLEEYMSIVQDDIHEIKAAIKDQSREIKNINYTIGRSWEPPQFSF
jgi:hypothetical protein